MATIIWFYDYVPLSKRYEILDKLKQKQNKETKNALKILKTPLSKRKRP